MILGRFIPALGLVATCWLVLGLNTLLWNGQLNHYGIVPRHFDSLPAILWAPFLHASVSHLTANSVPLLALGAILCARSKTQFMLVAAGGALLTGALTWVFGRSGSHIGASGLIFCFFGYLASLALFRRTFGSLLLSAACILLYGGLLKGLVPTSAGISWESHLAGLISGVILASFSSKTNQKALAVHSNSARELLNR